MTEQIFLNLTDAKNDDTLFIPIREITCIRTNDAGTEIFTFGDRFEVRETHEEIINYLKGN